MKRRATKYIVVHVTATPPNWDKGMAGLKAIANARGWARESYAATIRRLGANNGKVEWAPGGTDVIRNHVRGFNSIAVGVSLIGGVDSSGRAEHNATPAQMRALEMVLRKLVAKYPNAKICGHRDLSPDRDGDGIIEPHEHLKACPCFDVIPWAAAKGLPVANIKGVWSAGSVRAPKAPDARNVYLQKLLAMAGYEFGAIDGYVGKKTMAAIKRFQTANGLPVTGAFDRPTVNLLRDTYERSRPAPKPVRVAEVDRLISEVEETSSIGSKTNIAAMASGAAAVTGAGMQVVENVNSMMQAAPWIVVALLAAAFAGYIIYSRMRKSKYAKEARRAQSDLMALETGAGHWPAVDDR
jgi:hypothetical protein